MGSRKEEVDIMKKLRIVDNNNNIYVELMRNSDTIELYVDNQLILDIAISDDDKVFLRRYTPKNKTIFEIDEDNRYVLLED